MRFFKFLVPVPTFTLLAAAALLPACSSSSSSGDSSTGASSGESKESSHGSEGASSNGSDKSSNKNSHGGGSSSSHESTPGASSSGSSSSGTTASGNSRGADAGPVCNDLTPGGSVVNGTCKEATGPTAEGGTIVDGTYNLTSVEIYYPDCLKVGTAGFSEKSTLVVSGNGTKFELVSVSGSETSTMTETITTSGTQVTSTPTCGQGGAGTAGYTATSTTFKLFDVGPLTASTADSGVPPTSATIVITFTQ